MGLYVFDCIVVVFDNRFTATDVAILRSCMRFQIPTLVVRSKSSQHIQQNLASDMGGADADDDDAEEDVPDVDQRMESARARYVQDSREIVRRDLQAAGLPPQPVYFVDKDVLVKIVRGGSASGIDEKALLRRMFELAPPQVDDSDESEVTMSVGSESQPEWQTDMSLSDKLSDFELDPVAGPSP
ncbi:uncharacterized protein B0H18DRAFT_1214518 [Fomitopsis serialis]|uniref:uncharacterized protein n=1 Tax=Fomitopsis serialis TaxID=139415 RepID=UPI002007ABFE|nr:uncharacterized protein B0H18DRAFT_1214518 [Neoantrodia serialis]KAH9917606.1 hypothetical protein B0H18DRAFT_1214518 [Neoantrodia serialis]